MCSIPTLTASTVRTCQRSCEIDRGTSCCTSAAAGRLPRHTADTTWQQSTLCGLSSIVKKGTESMTYSSATIVKCHTVSATTGRSTTGPVSTCLQSYSIQTARGKRCVPHIVTALSSLSTLICSVRRMTRRSSTALRRLCPKTQRTRSQKTVTCQVHFQLLHGVAKCYACWLRRHTSVVILSVSTICTRIYKRRLRSCRRFCRKILVWFCVICQNVQATKRRCAYGQSERMMLTVNWPLKTAPRNEAVVLKVLYYVSGLGDKREHQRNEYALMTACRTMRGKLREEQVVEWNIYWYETSLRVLLWVAKLVYNLFVYKIAFSAAIKTLKNKKAVTICSTKKPVSLTFEQNNGLRRKEIQVYLLPICWLIIFIVLTKEFHEHLWWLVCSEYCKVDGGWRQDTRGRRNGYSTAPEFPETFCKWCHRVSGWCRHRQHWYSSYNMIMIIPTSISKSNAHFKFYLHIQN